MKLLRKERLNNGRRHIYFLGFKIFSYKKKQRITTNQHEELNDFIVLCTDEKLPILLKKEFFKRTGKMPDEELETLTEKIIWNQMFGSTKMKEKLSDKYNVREFISQTIGKEYLIPLLAVWDKISEINIDSLPNRFVVKFSEGSGKNFLVKDKTTLNINTLKEKIRNWQNNYFWTQSFEMQYKNNSRKIIVEEFINTKIEYKLWMFNQECKFIKIEIMQTFAEDGKPDKQFGKYFYPDWTPADFKTIGEEPNFEIPKPKKLSELLKVAKTLSEGFDFVRIDFFEDYDGNIKFGEMTFSPAAGNIHFVPQSKNKEFGKQLTLNKNI